MRIIQKDISLKDYTTFHIGGPAEFFVSVRDTEEIQEALKWAKNNDQDIFILGGGSNILISDQGIKGLVITFEDAEPKVKHDTITCFTGTSLEKLLDAAQSNGLKGMQKMAGIPGLVGGAVRGNAGAFGIEIKDVVKKVSAIHKETLELHTFTKKECEFAYRMSFFKKHPAWIVVEAEFSLEKGDSETLRAEMEEIKSKRNAKQNQEAWCAGSFFMNPVVEDTKLLEAFKNDAGVEARGDKIPAGWLIDRVDLRGKKIGGAQISTEHPNYIINTGDATAEDVIMLMGIIKQHVRDKLHVQLQQEVQFVGFA